MNTTGNSSPFAVCSVIIVTASASGSSRSSSLDERRALQEMVERTQADFTALVDHQLGARRARARRTLSRRSSPSGPSARSASA